MQQSQAQHQESSGINSQSPLLSNKFPLHKFQIAQAIYKKQLSVHMSELMGCDYIFVTHYDDHPLLHSDKLALSIQELIDILESTPNQTRVILVNLTLDQPVFSCCEFTRQKGRITQASSYEISNPEQLAFFQLIYDCAETY